MDYNNLLSGYKERVMRIALFDIFSSLEKKQKKDDDGKPIDFFGIGLLSLMFFFENMLKRNKKTGINELAQFLYDIQKESMSLTKEGYFELAKMIVETMRPPSGKRNKREFFNYELGEMDTVEYSILKADSWDKENNLQYYVLDEQGLELVFATKEYFSEFQISISQLLLRKQLEKGEFQGALRQIEEMRINVNMIKDKIHHIKHDIQRNIISDETYERYKELIGDINRRLNIEHDEFEELTSFIKDTKLHLDATYTPNDRDKKAFEYIVRVDNELARVHQLHSNLLKESIELKTTALDSASESLYFVGLNAFNFDQEITRKVMSKPLPFESVGLFTKPFMQTMKHSGWSLLTVFSEQMVEKDGRELNDKTFVDIDEHSEISKERKQQQEGYKYIFNKINNLIGDHRQITIKELLENKSCEPFNTREFYDFFIILHQLSPVSVDEIIKSKEHVFATAFTTLNENIKTISVVELEDEITLDGSYDVKNMRLSFGDEQHD